MNYFYLTTNELNREPEVIKTYDYCHIKAKVDGSQTLILVEEKINHKDLEELTQEEAQTLLDSWIDAENETPEKIMEEQEVEETTGEGEETKLVKKLVEVDVIQKHIDLNKFI